MRSTIDAPAARGRAIAPASSAGARLQLAKLRTLLTAINGHNPFYTHKLGTPGAFPALTSIEQFTREVPFTTKSDIIADQLSRPPYGTNLTFPRSAYVRCHQTSGTTSTPISWLDTAESWRHIVGNWKRIFDAAGVVSSDRFLFAFSFGPFLGFWSALEAAQKLSCFCFTGGAMTSLARWQALRNHELSVLCCTPTYARHLGEVARDAGLKLPLGQLRLIIVAGEPGGSIPVTRAVLSALWPGATVYDHHGMTEVGPVSYQCPAQPGTLHVLESAYLAEVIDPRSDRPMPDGDVGELVLTTLDRLGSPLLRYRTGDLVRARPRGTCRCGRSELALDGGILGRCDDMTIVRGVNVFPSMIEDIVRAHPEADEYRVTVDTRSAMTELALEVECPLDDAAAKNLQKRLEQSLLTALNLRVPVQICAPGTLPRFEMKAHRWIKRSSVGA
jgi:phenylacetate-CoA ligase